MRLAVVIPCYNHEAYVGDAIRSVLGQSRPPERFLVIDDGSRDRSVEVIRGFEKDGVECLEQENAGAHNTLNRAIEKVAMDCDAIAILNSDDLYEPERFSRCLPVLEGDPARSVVVSGLQMIDEKGDRLEEAHPRERWCRAVWSLGEDPDFPLWEWMARANFPLTSSNILGRAAYLLANPFQPYRFNHDYFFLSGAAVRDQVTLVKEPLLQYRVHPENNINSDPAPLLKEMLRMQLDLYALLADELGADAALRQRFRDYALAAWGSVSAFSPGLFQVLTARLAAGVDEAARASLIDGLDPETFVELETYPNKEAVNAWTPGTVLPGLGSGGGDLAEKVGRLKEKAQNSETERRAARELASLRNGLLRSRWMALGRVIGAGKDLGGDVGQDAAAKLKHLREGLASSGWLRLGAGLGSRLCRDLAERAAEPDPS